MRRKFARHAFAGLARSAALTSGMKPSSSVCAPIASSASHRHLRGLAGAGIEIERQLGHLGLRQPRIEAAGAGDPLGQIAADAAARRHRPCCAPRWRPQRDRADRTSPPAHRRAASSLAVRDLSVAPLATISTGQGSPSSHRPTSSTSTASCASSPWARTADVTRVAEQRAGARLVAQPHRIALAARRPTVRFARRDRRAARRSARRASCAPASSGPQKKKTCAARGAAPGGTCRRSRAGGLHGSAAAGAAATCAARHW
jgi:hypothetical protein